MSLRSECWNDLNIYEKVLAGAIIVIILSVLAIIFCVFAWIWRFAPEVTGKLFLTSIVILVIAVATGVVAVKLEDFED